MLRDAFGYADDERDFGRDGFFDAGSGEGWAVISYIVRGGIVKRGEGEVAYGTKIAEAVAPVSLIASRTLAKTGLPRCVVPAFLGLVPPTTLVPGNHQCER